MVSSKSNGVNVNVLQDDLAIWPIDPDQQLSAPNSGASQYDRGTRSQSVSLSVISIMAVNSPKSKLRRTFTIFEHMVDLYHSQTPKGKLRRKLPPQIRNSKLARKRALIHLRKRFVASHYQLSQAHTLLIIYDLGGWAIAKTPTTHCALPRKGKPSCFRHTVARDNPAHVQQEDLVS